MNPALYFIVTNSDDGYQRRENVRVVVCDTVEEASAEAAKAVGIYTYVATLYAVTDEGYRGERITEHRYQR